MSFSVRLATLEEKPIIHSLLQSYLAELSRLPDEYPFFKDENGFYLYPALDSYWQEKGKFPYLFFKDNELVGFALVRKDGIYWEMTEIYVQPSFRRRPLAEACAFQIIKKYTGMWRLIFNKHNISRKLAKKLAERLSRENIVVDEFDKGHDYIIFSV